MDPSLQLKLQQLVHQLAQLDSDLTQRFRSLQGQENASISQTRDRLAACIALAEPACGQEDEDILQALITSIGVLSAAVEQLVVQDRKRPGLVGFALLRAAKTLLGSIQISSKTRFRLTPRSHQRYLEAATAFLGGAGGAGGAGGSAGRPGQPGESGQPGLFPYMAGGGGGGGGAGGTGIGSSGGTGGSGGLPTDFSSQDFVSSNESKQASESPSTVGGLGGAGSNFNSAAGGGGGGDGGGGIGIDATGGLGGFPGLPPILSLSSLSVVDVVGGSGGTGGLGGSVLLNGTSGGGGGGGGAGGTGPFALGGDPGAAGTALKR